MASKKPQGKELYAVGNNLMQDIKFSASVVITFTLAAMLVAFWYGVDPLTYLKLVLK